LNANSFFNTERRRETRLQPEHLRRNSVVPSADRLFFFMDYQQTRRVTAGRPRTVVPQSFRKPATFRYIRAKRSSTHYGLPFLNNMIPDSRACVIRRGWRALFADSQPLSTPEPRREPVRTATAATIYRARPGYTNNDRRMPKIDYRITRTTSILGDSLSDRYYSGSSACAAHQHEQPTVGPPLPPGVINWSAHLLADCDQ